MKVDPGGVGVVERGLKGDRVGHVSVGPESRVYRGRVVVSPRDVVSDWGDGWDVKVLQCPGRKDGVRDVVVMEDVVVEDLRVVASDQSVGSNHDGPRLHPWAYPSPLPRPGPAPVPVLLPHRAHTASAPAPMSEDLRTEERDRTGRQWFTQRHPSSITKSP